MTMLLSGNDTIFYTVENAGREPLARGDAALAFSSREKAQSALDSAEFAGGRVVRYAGQYDLFCFFERILNLGAQRVIVDDGERGSMAVRLSPATWDWKKFRRARAQAAGLAVL